MPLNASAFVGEPSPCWGRRIGSYRPPRDKDAIDGVDPSLAQELNELSVQEREAVFDEVHGVAKPLEETLELIQESFLNLKRELARIPKKSRKAYDRAVFLKPSLECDDKFKLMFLRAERFDASAAAWRMVGYFNSKLELFGEEKLVKKLNMDDLSETDKAAGHSGSFHIFPQRDQAGRGVFMLIFKNTDLQNFVAHVSVVTTVRTTKDIIFLVDKIHLMRFFHPKDSFHVVSVDDSASQRRCSEEGACLHWL